MEDGDVKKIWRWLEWREGNMRWLAAYHRACPATRGFTASSVCVVAQHFHYTDARRTRSGGRSTSH